jgi:hypothetical protein
MHNLSNYTLEPKVNETHIVCKITPPECNRHRTTGRRPIQGIMKILTNQDVPTVDGKYSAKSPRHSYPTPSPNFNVEFMDVLGSRDAMCR